MQTLNSRRSNTKYWIAFLPIRGYILNQSDEIIYIGKSNNIRKRLLSHLTSKNSKSQKISAQLAQVSFEKTGSEAIALLKEQNEIKKNHPPLNRAAKQR
ncbi:MAG: nucleotide excision repair endonuclease, partial [Flavobacteriaceae bacterium]